jgi:hypothetical protein
MKADLNQLAARVHSANAKWWTDLETGLPIERNRYELLALVISEVSECLEGERKSLMDDKLPHRRMAEVEMADAYIRLLDYAGGFGIELSHERPWRIPDNVGEAMLELTRIVAHYEDISDALGYIECYCEKHGYDLEGAIEEKLVYNQTREDHQIEARKAANGKKF